MVLSPDELEKRVENTIKTYVDNLTVSIDRYLEDQRLLFGNTGKCSYPLSDYGKTDEVRQKVLARIITAYQSAGWDVTHIRDEDEELTFKKKK
ncbi:MAG: hypothetical protein WC852_04085 [Candidatus Nanoarchaeia archaeon]|jgi:hypothetical protein